MNKNKLKQKGGVYQGKTVNFKPGKNNPYKSTYANKEHANNAGYNKPKQQNENLISFQISDKLLQQQQQQVPAYKQIYPAPYVPIQIPQPGAYFTGANNGPMFNANNVPIIQNTTINTGGINAEHVKLNNIYEDILPVQIRKTEFASIEDRIIFFRFLRSTFLRNADGEVINLNDTGSKNNFNTFKLLDRVKYMDVNPYAINTIYQNPYRNLPEGMILFRSCYPMTFDMNSYQPKCSYNSLGINIRLYGISTGAFHAKKIGRDYDWNKFNLWREIGFYEYIRDTIIKTKVCPNFPIMFSYYLTQGGGFNFNKFEQIRLRYLNANQIKLEKRRKEERTIKIRKALREQLNLQELSNITEWIYIKDNIKVTYGAIIFNTKTNKTAYIENIKDDIIILRVEEDGVYNKEMNITEKQLKEEWERFNNRNKYLDNLTIRYIEVNGVLVVEKIILNKLISDFDPEAQSNHCLVALTEAYTSPIRVWASRKYEKNINVVNKMINTGFHKDIVWASILFQLYYAILTLQFNDIALNEMTLNDNVYIKKVGKEDIPQGYWKYMVDDIEFFIPNYGYMVIIDSNYKYNNQHNITLEIPTIDNNNDYKIFSTSIYKPYIEKYSSKQKKKIQKKIEDIISNTADFRKDVEGHSKDYLVQRKSEKKKIKRELKSMLIRFKFTFNSKLEEGEGEGEGEEAALRFNDRKKNYGYLLGYYREKLSIINEKSGSIVESDTRSKIRETNLMNMRNLFNNDAFKVTSEIDSFISFGDKIKIKLETITSRLDNIKTLPESMSNYTGTNTRDIKNNEINKKNHFNNTLINILVENFSEFLNNKIGTVGVLDKEDGDKPTINPILNYNTGLYIDKISSKYMYYYKLNKYLKINHKEDDEEIDEEDVEEDDEEDAGENDEEDVDVPDEVYNQDYIITDVDNISSEPTNFTSVQLQNPKNKNINYKLLDGNFTSENLIDTFRLRQPNYNKYTNNLDSQAEDSTFR